MVAAGAATTVLAKAGPAKTVVAAGDTTTPAWATAAKARTATKACILMEDFFTKSELKGFWKCFWKRRWNANDDWLIGPRFFYMATKIWLWDVAGYSGKVTPWKKRVGFRRIKLIALIWNSMLVFA